MDFRWNIWNIEHVAEHGVMPWEAEEVVEGARPPYPERRGDGKWLVCGRTRNGRLLQVIYVLGKDKRAFVIHARPLTPTEHRRFRRRTRI